MRLKSTIFALLLCLSAPARAIPEIMVPAYFDPASDPALWSQMNAAALTAPLTAIMNPNSGPGVAADASYTSAINALRSNGGKVIGYVATGYNGRSAAAVKLDIDRYLSFYPMIDGIFLDEMTNGTNASDLAFYLDLYNYIKGKSAALRVFGNPGINAAEAYLSRTDVLVIFESPETSYAGNMQDLYVAGYPSNRFAMIALNQPSSSGMIGDLDLALSRNTGYVYITNDSGGNPFDTLPSYFSNEVTAVAARQPPPGSSATLGGGSGGAWGPGLLPLALLAAWRRRHSAA